MADVKLKFAGVTTLTIANANLATSPTAGWQSDAQDYSSNLYLDALVQVKLAAVNTAPANNKAIYLYAFGLSDTSGSDYGTTGDGVPSGTEGTLTFPDITTGQPVCPLLGIIPYTTQNKVIVSPLFSIARCFGGVLPPKVAIGMINYASMTLNVTSIKILPVYLTVI